MAAPCAPLGSLLTYLPTSLPSPSRPSVILRFSLATACAAVAPRRFLALPSSPYVPVSVPSSFRKRVARKGKREREKGRKRDKSSERVRRARKTVTRRETLLGATIGAKSVPSGCLHQFYHRFLNPAVRTDSARPRLGRVV